MVFRRGVLVVQEPVLQQGEVTQVRLEQVVDDVAYDGHYSCDGVEDDIEDLP